MHLFFPNETEFMGRVGDRKQHEILFFGLLRFNVIFKWLSNKPLVNITKLFKMQIFFQQSVYTLYLHFQDSVLHAYQQIVG